MLDSPHWLNICVSNKVIYDVSNSNDYVYAVRMCVSVFVCVLLVNDRYALSIARDQVFILCVQNVMYERNGICACHPSIPHMSSLLSYAFIFTHHTQFAIIVMMRQPTTIFRIFWSRFVCLFSLCTYFLFQLISLCPSPTFCGLLSFYP